MFNEINGIQILSGAMVALVAYLIIMQSIGKRKRFNVRVGEIFGGCFVGLLFVALSLIEVGLYGHALQDWLLLRILGMMSPLLWIGYAIFLISILSMMVVVFRLFQRLEK